jgi:hypothetical protein
MKAIHPRIVGEASIAVGEVAVTPATSHLFALLLILVLGPPEGSSRMELQELLFDDPRTGRAAHRLRQLLYKLRLMGVSVHDSPGGVLRAINPISDALSAALDLLECQGQQRLSLAVLPHYSPPLPRAFCDWLQDTRERAAISLHSILLARLHEAQTHSEWGKAAALADALQDVDPLDPEAVMARAQVRAVQGSEVRTPLRLIRRSSGSSETASAKLRWLARPQRSTAERYAFAFSPSNGRTPRRAAAARCW